MASCNIFRNRLLTTCKTLLVHFQDDDFMLNNITEAKKSINFHFLLLIEARNIIAVNLMEFQIKRGEKSFEISLLLFTRERWFPETFFTYIYIFLTQTVIRFQKQIYLKRFEYQTRRIELRRGRKFLFIVCIWFLYNQLLSWQNFYDENLEQIVKVELNRVCWKE